MVDILDQKNLAADESEGKRGVQNERQVRSEFG